MHQLRMESRSLRSHNGMMPLLPPPLARLISCRTFNHGGLLRDSDTSFSRDWALLGLFNINHNTEAPVNLPVATAISGDAGRAGTVLGKRVRERYGIYRRNAPQSLMITAAALHRPERGKGQAPVGSRRQRDLLQGFTEHLLPRPNKRTKHTSMTA